MKKSKMPKTIDMLAVYGRIPFSGLVTEIVKGSSQLERAGGLSAILGQENLYRSPTGYLDWDTHLKVCVAHLNENTINTAYSRRDGLELMTIGACVNALRHKAPARYVSKEICEAFVNTPIPDVGAELSSVFPALHIFLPRNYLFDWEGCEIPSIVIRPGVLRPEGVEPSPLPSIWDNMEGFIEVPPDVRNAPTLDIVAFTGTGAIPITFVGGWSQPADAEKAFTYRSLERIAVNSLLVHLYESELITADSSNSTAPGTGFGQNAKKGSLPTTWIGKTFRYQREDDRGPGVPRGPVQSHWRRGHWHTVLHGKQKAQRRTQWFKPVYVGGK
jgi:hypothetical protein